MKRFFLLTLCVVALVNLAVDAKEIEESAVQQQEVPEDDVRQDELGRDELPPKEQQSQQDVRDQEDVSGEEGLSKFLKDEPGCQEDLLAFKECGSSELISNNMALMACLVSNQRTRTRLSNACQNVLWAYKRELTREPALLKQIRHMCREDLNVFASCLDSRPNRKKQLGNEDSGLELSCFVDRKNNLEEETKLTNGCNSFLDDVELIVFSDYRLVKEMIDACDDDVVRLQCGKIDVGDAAHSQGEVVSCLESHLSALDSECQTEILKLAELQAEDFHLDRNLYAHCRSDRRLLCPNVKAGKGRVYQCLLSHIQDPSMSNECRESLALRQRLVSSDFRIDTRLSRACRKEIKRNKCDASVDANSEHTVKLSTVLLCLEDVLRNSEDAVSGECVREMEDQRKAILTDQGISPEIITLCAKDTQNCKKGQNIAHCLMERIMTAGSLSSGKECERALSKLLREADVASDWQVDPVLKAVCQTVVLESCEGAEEGDVLSCLFSLRAHNSHHMNNECGMALDQIEYFVARDFVLDNKLYKRCKEDAARVCHAEDDWHRHQVSSDSNDNAVAARLVFPCLVRNLYWVEGKDENDETQDELNNETNEKSVLSESCADEVERVLEQRAVSVHMHPEIEDACRDNLVALCRDKLKPGQEINCLQDNYDKLGTDCQKSVATYTRLEAHNPRLNLLIVMHCQDVLDNFCGKEENASEQSTMHCLIEYKTSHSTSLNAKCATAIEHWQILAMRDWRFSPNFKKACHSDVANHCPHSSDTKQAILGCLTEIIEDDLVKQVNKKRISKQCRNELKFQLLQKHSSLNLNPKLVKACHNELESLCGEEESKVECLKSQPHSNLGKPCLKRLFREEKEDALINDVDHALLKVCRNEISRHCQADRPDGVLECLKENMRDLNFDLKCKRAVVKRIGRQMRDFRLNPRLQRACSVDLSNFCESVLNEPNVDLDAFMEGAVIRCLRDTFLQRPQDMTNTCKLELTNVLSQSSVNIDARPRLLSVCPNAVAHCSKAVHYKETHVDDGQIEECVKKLFADGQLLNLGDSALCSKEVAQLVELGSSDIHLDPMLHSLCSLDLNKFCRSVSSGQGRLIACLKNVMSDAKLSLEPGCEQALKSRLDMYKEAIRVAPPLSQSLKDFYRSVIDSDQSFSILSLIGGFLMVVFIIGMGCGRCSARRHSVHKNK